MSRPATGNARRRANERYREGFLAQAATELREFALLLAEEPDAQEPVAFELQRLAETAETLELSTIARAASDAAEELAHSAAGVRALRRVANAIRHTGGRLRFGPICLVGVPPEDAERLLLDAELCCEPVYVFADLAAFASGLHTEQPTAVVLPAESTEAVTQLVSRENFPVLVHGPPLDADPTAWERYTAAMEAGAHGYLPGKLELADVTRLARWRNQQAEEPIDVIVAADDDAARAELVQALEQARIGVVTVDNAAELAAALGGAAKPPAGAPPNQALPLVVPHAVVLAARVDGVPAHPLAMLIRAHPRCCHVPVLVTGRPDDAGALRAVGVDDVMRSEAQAAQVAQRVRDRATRTSSLPWERDPMSGMPNRLGVLSQLDAELSLASRTGLVLSVAVIEMDGLRTAIEAFGASALGNVRRRVVRLFKQTLRRTDVFGEIAFGELVVAMPVCGQKVALQRIELVASRFADEAAADPQLKGITMVVGVADTSQGLRTVAVRAERELRAGGTQRNTV